MSTFGADLRKLISRAESAASEIVRGVALDTANEMIERCPVAAKGGGRLRSNIVCGINGINKRNTIPAGTDPKPAITSALTRWKIGDSIYITNSVPYAIVVEYGLYGKPPGSANGPKTVAGYSSQAVGGFVRLTAQNIEQSLRKRVAAL